MNYIYNLSINVSFAMKYKLDFTHCALIKYFLLLPNWANKMEKEGKTFYRANMSNIHEQLPMLSEKDDTVYRYIKKLISLGFIEKVKGLDYYHITPLCLEYEGIKPQSDDSEINPKNIGNKSETVSEINPIYNNTSNNNIKENIYMFEDFRKQYPIKKGKAKAEERYKQAIRSGYKHEDIMIGVERYRSEVAGKDPQYTKRAQGWLNEKRWMDEEITTEDANRNSAVEEMKKKLQEERRRKEFKNLNNPNLY